MCHSGARIGRTKAIDSALKASKKVALPITTRAMTNHRDVGTCSIRAIRWLAAASASKADEDEELTRGSERGAVLASGTFRSCTGYTCSTNARIFSAINSGHSIGVRWRTPGNTESVAFDNACLICSDIAIGVA